MRCTSWVMAAKSQREPRRHQARTRCRMRRECFSTCFKKEGCHESGQSLTSPAGRKGLVYEDVPDPKAGEGQVVVKVESIGLNFAEVNQRRNANPASVPMPIGGEAAGTEMVEVGAGVTQFKLGDRVAFNASPAPMPRKSRPRRRDWFIPDNVSTKQAAASLLQGMTAHYLACSTYPLGAKDTCVVHAAAGGVGLLTLPDRQTAWSAGPGNGFDRGEGQGSAGSRR